MYERIEWTHERRVENIVGVHGLHRYMDRA